jgi:uncharacterized protein YjdB
MKAARRFLLSSVFTTSTIALTIAGMGCQGIVSPSGSGGKTLSSLRVSPASASLQAGQTQQFTATAQYSDGSTANVSSTATWTVSSGSIASVSNAGMATAKATGSATVTASLNGINGSAALAVQSGTKTVTSVSVTPATATIAVGATQQFTATASYSDGTTSNVTSSGATWSSSAPSIATINASGLAAAVAAGQTTLTATYQGKSQSATLSATTATVTSVSVSPTSANLQVGATQQFTATATYSDGTTGNVTSSGTTWSSSAPSIATINGSGLATAVAAGQATLTATYQGKSGSAALTSTAVPVTSLVVTPTSVNLVVGGTEQFTATATYANGTTGNVTTSATWSSGNTSVVTVNSSGFAIAVGAGPATSVTASFAGFDSSATVNVSQSLGSGANIPMFHVDQNRSGTNPNETILTPANVTPQSFGKLFSQLVDGYVYGQPLLVSNLTMADGTTHNVLFAATENDSVYAFDADSNTGTNASPLWQVSLLQSGETPIMNGPIKPVEGVTSTPAIDLTTNTMYVVSTQVSAAGGTFRLNALDITSGSQRTGSPVQITAQVQGTNATTLTTACLQRAALLVAYGSVYIGFGSCHSGWLLAYDKTTLAQTGVFNSSPYLVGEGLYASAGGVWMGGGGPAADGQGNVYITTGNGPWDGQTAYSDSILKFSQTLQLEDYFTPYVYPYMDCADADLAAGGLLLIPASGATPMQALAGGKTGKLYLANTEDLGQEQNNDIGATYTTFFEPDLSPPYENTCTSSGSESGSAEINSYEIFGTATYFNGSVYLGVTPTGPVPAPVRQFIYSPGSSTPLAYNSNYTPNDYVLAGSYGTTTFISANSASDAVLWMIDHGDPLQNGNTQTNATLRVYNPSSLSSGELYDSNMAANGGDIPGYGIKFTAPIAANGKVYISTGHDLVSTPNPRGELDVYGLK